MAKSLDSVHILMIDFNSILSISKYLKHLFMRLFSLFFFILFTNILDGQLATNPHDVVYNHLKHLEVEHKNARLSAMSFHPDIPMEQRIDLAENLKQILDAKGILINVANIPNDPEYRDSLSGNQTYVVTRELPSITVEKYNNNWFYSKKTSAEIPVLFKKTFPAWSHGIINNIPDVLKTHVLGVEIWKFIGLLIILIVSFLLFKIFEKGIDKFMQISIWDRLHIEDRHLPKLHRLARYFGIIFFIGLIRYFLPILVFNINISRPIFQLINIVFTFVAMLAVLKITDIIGVYLRKLTAATASKIDDQLMPIAVKGAKVAVIIMGIFRILYLLDVNITALIAGLSIGGLALALAAQDTVKNLIGSVMIFFDRPFHIGDYIMAMDFEGTVEEVGFRSSRIRKVDNSLITVPNGNLTNATMINYGIRKFRLFETNLGFTYDSDPKNISAFIDDLKGFFNQYTHIQEENHFVYLRYLSASSIDVFVRAYIDAPTFKDELTYRQELIFTIMEKVKSNNLAFAYPSQSLYIESMPQQNNHQKNVETNEKEIQ